MKRFAVFAFSMATLFSQAPAASSEGLRSVYILPMANGLDQYLAERITQSHALVVVADPKTADVVLTDRLGPGFEQQMDRIEGKKADDTRPAFHSVSGRGTVFLVDAHSRRVLWSDYENPGMNPAREAQRIAKKLAGFGK